MNHGERKHSKFSASGAEKWMNCPGSVALSEGLPEVTSKYSIEGTRAHEVLECLQTGKKHSGTREMEYYGVQAANFINKLKASHKGAELMVETRLALPFIHPDMFGTMDSAVVDHFGTLHVLDYKYGVGHYVSPVDNWQMKIYGMGLAHMFDWNFSKVKLWIIQPRHKSYRGPTFWELGILDLKARVRVLKKAVERVEREPTTYAEGAWCYFCKAKGICPLKIQVKQAKTASVFAGAPLVKYK